MQQTGTGSYGWLQDGLLAEVGDNGKEAIECYYNSRCNIGEQFLDQEKLECTSAVM